MNNKIKKYFLEAWWLIVVFGASLMVFGFAALIFPNMTITLLMLFLAMLIIVWGASQAIRSFQTKDPQARASSLVTAALLIILGIVLFLNPTISVTTLAFVIGWVVMLRGIGDLILSAIFPSHSRSKLLWRLSGVVNIIASLVIWFFPTTSAQVFTIVIGCYAIINGAMLLWNAFELRRTTGKLSS
ncbi:MAG: DUF308 domain-containing protein [Candidatus Saccharimonas sp.]